MSEMYGIIHQGIVAEIKLIDKSPPEKIQAILLLLGVKESEIHQMQEGIERKEHQRSERRTGQDRRQNVEKVDFERRSGLDRRDDEGVRLSHNDLRKEAKKNHKTRKDDDAS